MIVMFKKEEVVDLIKNLEELERKFWLDYKFYNESNKHFLELRFQDLYRELEKHLDDIGIQEEMNI